MVTFNIFGNCVSRDILNPLINQQKAKVLQYSGFVNPVTVFSGTGEFEMKIKDLKDGTNFGKRILCQDYNKTSIEYFTQYQADYIIIDFIGARLDICKKGSHSISCSNPYYQNKAFLEKQYGLDTYQTIKSSEISSDELIENVDKFCKTVLKYYPLSKIIINEYYGAEQFIDNGIIKPFSYEIVKNVKRYNEIVKELNDYAEKRLLGCHVIKFADNVIADKSNVLGLNSLHYTSLYYEYGAKAIETIVKNLPDDEEAAILEDLRQICSDRFELLRKRAELKSKSFVIASTQNCSNFTKKLCFDALNDGIFGKNMEMIKEKNYKVAVLKSDDVAGQILLKALEKYGIPIIFKTAGYSLKPLSDDDFEKCRQADMIISANIHSNTIPERDGIKAILIKDLLCSF